MSEPRYFMMRTSTEDRERLLELSEAVDIPMAEVVRLSIEAVTAGDIERVRTARAATFEGMSVLKDGVNDDRIPATT